MGFRLTAIDLFAGAGGATQGLVYAGWSVLAAVENDPVAARTYELNHPAVKMIRSNIEDVDPAVLRRELGLRSGELKLLKACPPCQGYSSLRRGNSADPRNDLVDEVWWFVREFRPKALLLENVRGLGADSRLQILLKRIRAIGYGARVYYVDAADFGVPQRRLRLIVLAVKGRAAVQLPKRIEDKIPEHFDRAPVAAGKALALAGEVGTGNDPLHHPRPHSDVVMKRIRAIPIGGNRFDLPTELALACHSKIQGRRATAAYGRMRADEVAPTMTTRCTTPACGRFIHPTEDRAITLREAAILQTFPMGYQFHGGPGEIEKQIGNAVPVKMAEGLGQAVSSVLRSRDR